MGGDWEDAADANELNRLGGALQAATPSPYGQMSERHMPDWYMDFSQDLLYLEHYLKGEFFDPTNKKTPWVKKGNPMVNDDGSILIIGYLRSLAYSKNMIMTNIPNWDFAMSIARDICHGMNEMLHKHICLDDIALDVNDVSTINTTVRGIVRATVLRAMFEGERNRVSNTTQTQTRIDMGNGQPGGAPPQRANAFTKIFG